MEKVAFITGNPHKDAKQEPKGVHLEGEFQKRLEEFFNAHEGKIIDWHGDFNVGVLVRYEE